jgi:hypothetical protein
VRRLPSCSLVALKICRRSLSQWALTKVLLSAAHRCEVTLISSTVRRSHSCQLCPPTAPVLKMECSGAHRAANPEFPTSLQVLTCSKCSASPTHMPERPFTALQMLDLWVWRFTSTCHPLSTLPALQDPLYCRIARRPSCRLSLTSPHQTLANSVRLRALLILVRHPSAASPRCWCSTRGV